MERRFILFLVLSFAILLGYSGLMRVLYPPPPRPVQQQGQVATEEAGDKSKPPAGEQKEPAPTTAEKPIAEKLPAKAEAVAPAIKPVAEPATPEQWVMLGSADKDDPYRMLVTLTNKGAAVARIELNSPTSLYCDIDDRSGYLGHVAMDAAGDGSGCPVQFVGPGTPAAEAGLKPGDMIKSLTVKGAKPIPITDQKSLDAALRNNTKPGKKPVELVVERDGKELTLSAKLRRRPLDVVRPEGDDPLSMLLTLQQFDDQRIVDEEKPDEEKPAEKENPQEAANRKEKLNEASIGRELNGVALRTANWRLVESDQTHAEFRRTLPEKGLEIVKTYRLVKVPDASLHDENYPAYHLEFEIEVRNIGSATHKVAYRLDGPNGLPTEGAWYASKVSRNWGGSGLRDFVVSFSGRTPEMVSATSIASGKVPTPAADDSLTFIGVDAQYFSAVLMPQRDNPAEAWFNELLAIRVGKADPQRPNLVNTSCRMIGKPQELKPGGAITNRFKLFAGPKKPALLANNAYRLSELVYFGWPVFAVVAVFLTWMLHGFYAVTFNYGLAIILLTVLVRGCMFPVSRRQALGMKKMQELQPEIKKLQEKHKSNVEARTKAQQELFRKHNYNPMSGCLVMFIQLPVFIGLYRSLMVAIELRDAPLISNSIRWCSNLAAPDMLFNWSSFMPSFIVDGPGLLWLGPYFNLLPILTIVLFIWQQKMFMPPAADEQAAMQQKVMQYMMIFMGVLFFKVASGLCIYFIASSLWGMAERQFLPKTTPVAAGGEETRAQAKARSRQAATKGKK